MANERTATTIICNYAAKHRRYTCCFITEVKIHLLLICAHTAQDCVLTWNESIEVTVSHKRNLSSLTLSARAVILNIVNVFTLGNWDDFFSPGSSPERHRYKFHFKEEMRTKAGWCLQSQWWFKSVECNLMCFIKSEKSYRKLHIKGLMHSRWKEAKNTDNRNYVPLNQWPRKHIWQCQRFKKQKQKQKIIYTKEKRNITYKQLNRQVTEIFKQSVLLSAGKGSTQVIIEKLPQYQKSNKGKELGIPKHKTVGQKKLNSKTYLDRLKLYIFDSLSICFTE